MQALGSLPKSYAPPSITIIEINVESGFASSPLGSGTEDFGSGGNLNWDL